MLSKIAPFYLNHHWKTLLFILFQVTLYCLVWVELLEVEVEWVLEAQRNVMMLTKLPTVLLSSSSSSVAELTSDKCVVKLVLNMASDCDGCMYSWDQSDGHNNVSAELTNLVIFIWELLTKLPSHQCTKLFSNWSKWKENQYLYKLSSVCDKDDYWWIVLNCSSVHKHFCTKCMDTVFMIKLMDM